MKKKTIKLGCTLAVAFGLIAFSGCGSKNSISADEMAKKYSSMCTLPEYMGIEYEAVKTDITDELIQFNVDTLLSSKASTGVKASGKAEDGDVVNIDFDGSIDGEAFTGGHGAGYDLTLGSGRMIPGFEEQIVGHEVGEEFDINVTFPEEYPNDPSLQNVEAVFRIKINSVSTKIMPEYNDAFVAENTTYSTTKEYEDSIIENYEKNDKLRNKATLVGKIVEGAEILSYPEKEVEELIAENVKSVEDSASSYGYDLESYVQGVYGMDSEESFREYVSESVKEFLTEKIVVCSIAYKENITVSKDELLVFKKQLMETYGYDNEAKFDEAMPEGDLMYYALSEKVTDYLLENAKPVYETEDAAEDTSEDASEDTAEDATETSEE